MTFYKSNGRLNIVSGRRVGELRGKSVVDREDRNPGSETVVPDLSKGGINTFLITPGKATTVDVD